MEINLNTDFQLALLDQSANDLLMHYIWVWINSLKYNFGILHNEKYGLLM